MRICQITPKYLPGKLGGSGKYIQSLAEGSKVMNFKRNFILISILIFLFLLPFLWTPQDIYSLGGDDSRLYLYSPYDWLRNVALWPWFSFAGFNNFAPQQAHLPFTILGSAIKWLFPELNFQKTIYGVTLALGFLSVYLFLKTLLPREKNGKGSSLFVSGIIGGFAYIFLPLLYYRWGSPLNSIYGVFIYPFLFLFFLKAIQKRNIKYLIFGALLSILGSISIGCFPFLLPFLIGTFVFLFSSIILLKKFDLKLCLKYGLIYVLLILLFNAFWLVPFLGSMVLGNRVVSMALDQTVRGTTSDSILNSPTVASMNIVDTLLGLMSRQFILKHRFWFPADSYTLHNIKFSPLNLILLLIAFGGFLVRRRREETRERGFYLCIALTFLVLAFFQTVNVGDLGVALFAFMIKTIPGFLMLRTFYGKFPMAYSFFYGSLVGVSLYLILNFLRRSFFKILLCFSVLTALFIQALPFLDGRVNSLPHNIDTKLDANIKFSENFLKSIDYIRQSKQDIKILGLPLSVGSWSTIKDENSQALYSGGSPLKIWTGIDEFNSILAFNSSFMPGFSDTIIKSFLFNQHLFLKRIFGLLNIGYVFYRPGIYGPDVSEGVKNKLLWGYSEGFDQKEAELFLRGFSFENKFGEFSIYKLPEEFFLPHFYIPKEFLYIQGGENLVDAASFEDWEIRSEIYLAEDTDGDADNLEDADKIFVIGECLRCDSLEETKIELPFIRFLPDSVFYPLISWKEKRWEGKIKNLNDPIQLIDLDLGLASKRLAEVERLVNEEKGESLIGETVKRYQARIDDLFPRLRESEKEGRDINDALFRIEDYLKEYRKVLIGLLGRELGSEMRIWFENALWKVEDLLFEIKSKQWTSEERVRRYTFNIPKETGYELFVKDEGMENYFIQEPLSPVVFELDGKLATKSEQLRSDNWILVDKVNLEKGKHKLAIILPEAKNLIEKQSLLLEQEGEGRRLVSLPISNFDSAGLYKISFDYKTLRGKPAEFVVIQDTDKEDEELGRVRHKIERDLYRDVLSQTFEVFFEPDLGAKRAEFGFILEADEGRKSIFEIENIRVERIWSPKIVLRTATEKTLPTREMPKITFRKINPTKYEVGVEGVKGPYALVFSESFHQGWKAYINNQQSTINNQPEGNIIASYFDGEIKEGSHQNIFLDRNTFETWGKKPISEDRHYLVNGYANSWYITPEDAGGAENYKIIIEFWPQRFFYIGIAVSVLSLLGCLGYLSWSLVKERRIWKE